MSYETVASSQALYHSHQQQYETFASSHAGYDLPEPAAMRQDSSKKCWNISSAIMGLTGIAALAGGLYLRLRPESNWTPAGGMVAVFGGIALIGACTLAVVVNCTDEKKERVPRNGQIAPGLYTYG